MCQDFHSPEDWSECDVRRVMPPRNPGPGLLFYIGLILASGLIAAVWQAF